MPILFEGILFSEGLLDISSVPSRPRGHPSRLYSDLALMQHLKSNELTNSVVTSSVMQSPESSSQDDGSSPEDKNSQIESDKKSRQTMMSDGEIWPMDKPNKTPPLLGPSCLATKTENFLESSSPSIF